MDPLCLTNWLEPLFSAKLPPKLVQHVSFGWIQFIHQIPLFIPWIWPSSSILNYGIFLFVKYIFVFVYSEVKYWVKRSFNHAENWTSKTEYQKFVFIFVLLLLDNSIWHIFF